MKNAVVGKITGFYEDNKDTISIVCVGVMAWLSAKWFSPKAGDISVYPLIAVFVLLSALFPIDYKAKAALYFVFGLVMSVIEGGELMHCVYYALVCTAFAVFAAVAVRLFKAKKRKKMCRTLAAVLSFAIFLTPFLFTDIPTNRAKKTDVLLSYVNEHYPDEPLKLETPYYNHVTGGYTLKVAYKEEPTEKSNIILCGNDADGISDGYIEFAEKYVLEKGALELALILRNAYSSHNFTVTPEKIVNYPRGNIVTCTAEHEDYALYSDINIFIENALTKNQFVSRAESYFNTIMKSGFKCRSVTFYGGERGVYYAEITVPLISMHAPFDSLLIAAEK